MEAKINKKPTYITLFSSAGVGCYGFKASGFDCIATNEYLEKRINIQKCNHKCKYDSGYICGDITTDEVKNKLRAEINMWKTKEGLEDVDVIVATPPCQGMSIANRKMNDKEIVRNSLVVESIKIIKEIKPKFFVFENVPAFMKTPCTDVDGKDKPIKEAIEFNLQNDYVFIGKVLDFKDYGSNSRRRRTLVIGARKELNINPEDLFPSPEKEKTLRQVIGHLKPLNTMGEIDNNDIYHFFREYKPEMRAWVHDIKEGQSSFDNTEDEKKPHKVVDGKIVINTNVLSSKYRRQIWDRVAPCIHTRSDIFASQNTIHPKDDRVFSIRELMLMMTIPEEFKWSNEELTDLNKLSLDEKKKYLKKEEIKIRQSIGEAVPTVIFKKIATNIKKVLQG